MEGSYGGGGGVGEFSFQRALKISCLVKQSFAIRVRCLSGYLWEIFDMSQGTVEVTAIIFICAVFY